MLVDRYRRNIKRLVWTQVLGLLLGGLLTQLSELFLPQSAAKSFLTTAVEASIGPLSIDLIAVAFTIITGIQYVLDRKSALSRTGD